MPIPGDEFDRGESGDTLHSRVEKFLAKNSDQAFTHDEILIGVSSNERIPFYGDALNLTFVLMALGLQDRIKSKYIRTANGPNLYYQINKSSLAT